MADDTYEFLIHLSGGQTVVTDVTAADLDRITADNPTHVVPEADGDDRLRAAATLLYSMLLHRVGTRTGEIGVRDREGRNWTIPATSIVAFSYRAPDGSAGRALDFVKPKATRGAYSSS
ncbi:MAG: hypothetical protein ACYDAN_07345 [Candidatus Limnocylindrales bacterium]